MAVTKEEKLLASIEGTFKDILKELKRNPETKVNVHLDGKKLMIDTERFRAAQEAIRGRADLKGKPYEFLKGVIRLRFMKSHS